MSKKIPNWTDLYSFEDYVKAQQAFSTFNCGLSPVCLFAPTQHYCIGANQVFGNERTHSATINIRTLKLEYAIQVWTKAALISSTNGNPLQYYWWLQYEETSSSFRELRYSKSYGIDQRSSELIKGFWNLLEEIANSESIKVREGYTVANQSGHCSSNVKFSVVLDMPKAEWRKANLENIYEYPFNLTSRSFRWEEIKDLFIELNLHQLSLYDNTKLHKHDSCDDLLFWACKQSNLDLIKRAVQLGANVNALDKDGESALQKVIEFCRWNGMFVDKNYTAEEEALIIADNYRKCHEIVEYLVSQGADVDLYGVDGLQPLLCAYYDGNLDIIKLLFNHGSNPNYNSYRCDDARLSYTHRSTLIKVLDDEIDDYTDFQREVDKLARQYGGHHYDFDFNPHTCSHLGQSFISFSASKTDKIFFDNGNCAIGSPSQLTFEECNDHLTTFKLPEIPGLQIWLQDYRDHVDNPRGYDWDAWNERGLQLAQEVANILPESVALHYYYGHSMKLRVRKDQSCYFEHSGMDVYIAPMR